MLDMMINGKRLKGVSFTAFRLIALGAMDSNAVGVMEVEMYDSTGVNVCRATATIPTVTFSPKAASGPNVSPVNFPGSNTIDGNSSVWTSTCYLTASADGSAWLQYDFPKSVNIERLHVIFEGSFSPTPTGLAFQILVDGQWLTLRGTMNPPSGYTSGVWYRFADLRV